MANKFLPKKIIIPAVIFFSGLLIATGFLVWANFTIGDPLNSFHYLEWAQETGMGTSVPACTSSSASATCSGDGFTRVEFNWNYNGMHGACTSAQVRLLYPAGPANSRMAYGVINSKLYIAQGYPLGTGGRYFNPATMSWSSIANAPDTNGVAPASAVANGKLYSFGSETHEYDPSTYTWATLTPPPVDFTWWQATAANNKIYVAKDTRLYEYNPMTYGWTLLVPAPRSHGEWPAVASIGDNVYVVGYLNTDVYNTLTGSWTMLNNIPNGEIVKEYASGAAYGGKVYVFGGGAWDAPTAETWEYDPSLNTWSRKEDMPIQRNVPAVGVIGSEIFVYGGAYPGVYVSKIHRFKPSSGSYGHASNLACPPETNSYVASDLPPNTLYSYVVEILNGYSVIDVSDLGSFTTSNCIPADLIIQSPDISGTLVSGNDLSFSGEVKNQGGVTAGASQTRLQIDIGNNGSWDITLDNPTSPIDAGKDKKIDWDDAWTAQAGTHSYRIIADATNQVSESNEANNDTGPITFTVVPAPPGDFTLNPPSATCNSVSLSWTASAGADGYRIFREAPRIDITPYNPYTALNFVDYSVSQNTTYLYQIEAYNSADTNRSNARNITTLYCPPTLNFSGDPTVIYEGQISTLTWSSTYTTSCTASGAWSGSKALNGNQIVIPLPPPSVTYNLQCSGSGGTTPVQPVTITITPLGLPGWKEIIPR